MKSLINICKNEKSLLGCKMHFINISDFILASIILNKIVILVEIFGVVGRGRGDHNFTQCLVALIMYNVFREGGGGSTGRRHMKVY